MKIRLLSAALLAIGAAAAVSAQQQAPPSSDQPQPTFRAATELIAIDGFYKVADELEGLTVTVPERQA